MATPRFALIKDHIVHQIAQGDLAPGDRVPSENQLVSQFQVSRMTARRALHELADAGVLVRTQGLGSFVADRRPISSLVEIRNIAEEIQSRGHHYSCQVLALSADPADPQQAAWLGLDSAATLYQSTIVHSENRRPLQYEQRYINPAFAPEYLEQDFTQLTPNAYLSQVAPLTEADHVVEAVCAPAAIARHLDMDAQAPCLKVSRRTWSQRGVVSFAYLYHPGGRYRLGDHLNF
ncbi:histidine utilization repressor [Exilibacterium tricleocarpae]|uniref:Histidine utilization repressor n=1 Tax=Exilibacterium tricleocarpae TaxID=2591008 RepID=A0A545TNT9_9GAMM|nr:histidine utilization repressor [Exilibacterium tricleocarpae]TQV78883.1 histidine utilization repressor [Exilibacterium tricleocarpae]